MKSALFRDQQRTILTLIEAEGVLKDARKRLNARVELVKDAGISQLNYLRLHRSFEKASPESHRRFLRHLGFSSKDITSLLRKV